MDGEPETPTQRQARIRREKREAKLRANPQDRLNSITKLSGRTPESTRNASPAPTPPIAQSPTPAAADQNVSPASSLFAAPNDDPEQKRLQEEYMKMLFGGAQQGQQAQQGQRQSQSGVADETDPMLQMMQSLLGNISGDPNAPPADTNSLPLSSDDIAKMTGLPSFLTSMFMGAKQAVPPTPEQTKQERLWKVIRLVVSLLIGIYTVFIVDRSVSMFGNSPPRPATVQNPLLIFVMSQLTVNGARSVLGNGASATRGFKRYLQYGRDVASDAAVPLFMLGTYCWWSGYT